MLDLSLILTPVVIVFTLWFIKENVIGFLKRPPGPVRIPFLGNLIQILYYSKKEPHVHIMLQKFSKKYGRVSSLKFGTLEQLIIDDSTLIREILSSDNWCNRPINEYIMERSSGKPLGILWSNGEWNKELRRFSLRTLRDFGFGKSQSQEQVMEQELKELMTGLNSKLERDEMICMKQFFNISVLNIIWSMIASVRFNHNDPQFREKVKKINETMRLLSATGNVLLAYPFLSKIVPKLTGYGAVRNKSNYALQDMFYAILKHRRDLGEFGDDQRDYIDVFANEIEKWKASGNEGFKNIYSDEQFKVTVMDLFVAGSETTANSLEYAIMLMMLNPRVQDKVKEEIDKVIGRERFPQYLDKQSMPYTEATLLEIMRVSSVVPMVVRSPIEDEIVAGYKVPKNSWTILNTYSVHHDPKLWPKPEQFDPQRFLEDGKVVNAEKLIPFGLGKRYCLGEALARQTLFTFFVKMVQTYTFTKPKDRPDPSLKGLPGITLSPQEYYCIIKRRE